MKKYGLQLRVPPSQQKKQSKPPLHPLIFSDDIDEDIGGDIARQAVNKKVLRDVEEQHKKALEEDPSVFDYDGVYEEMKERTARPIIQDRQEKQSKYIHTLLAKAKEREREHDVAYERKLAKERNKDDHLFGDKEKFVTGAYKRKLAEQAKWLEEERIRELREEKDDATKKSDISDFYFNLGKNVAFGAGGVESSVAAKKEVKVIADTSERDVSPVMEPPSSSRREKDGDRAGFSAPSETNVDTSDGKFVPTDSLQVSNVVPKPIADQSDQDLHKKPEAALSAAKERFMARKRAKQQ
ncbi:hypothetical protein C5167_049772 [Papaver somniferum]|uniref:Nuclear speckle splicing regulatory protein 1 N-terminal domain-containing protein n=1 Tax=Papaver somniferum TaxID=3469 RepID=A0A4Y7KN43_PAPSO|nr:nuclear speckle splicing regulatory protein 1-like [Papaver somniferum]RZC74286.1 hypothetical protein C5167_049772 [Papaver somniferum]